MLIKQRSSTVHELTVAEIDFVSGGITENQCIGAATLGGGVIGGGIGFFAGGIGAFGGAGFGMGVGGALGMMFCTYIV
jgi:hypothetical protein